MNKLETAQQLRLAAEITESGKPWEVQLSTGKWGPTAWEPCSKPSTN